MCLKKIRDRMNKFITWNNNKHASKIHIAINYLKKNLHTLPDLFLFKYPYNVHVYNILKHYLNIGTSRRVQRRLENLLNGSVSTSNVSHGTPCISVVIAVRLFTFASRFPQSSCCSAAALLAFLFDCFFCLPKYKYNNKYKKNCEFI